jgi:uncharacterized RDD family membrane protein YckC
MIRDSSLGALTPEGIEFVLFPAGLPVRTAAYGIDKGIQWLILLAVSLSSAFLTGAIGAWLWPILSFCVEWFYHVICELAFRGQSPGKRIMGIRVVRADGAPVDPASSFLRNLLRFADTFFFLYPIALVTMAVSPGFRRLGDWAGGTLVVYTPKALRLARPSAEPPADWLSHYAQVTPARPLSRGEKQAVLMFARRYPLLGEARANEIARIYAPLLRGEEEMAGNGGLSDGAYLLGIARKLSGETGAAAQ